MRVELTARGGMVRHGLLAFLPVLATSLGLALWLGGAPSDEVFKVVRAAHPEAVRLLRLLTDWANPFFSVFYGLLFFYAWRTGNRGLMRLVLIYLVVQLAVSFGLVRVLKIAIGRPRPGVDGLFDSFSLAAGYNAMPSGHCAEFTASILPLVLWRRSTLLSLTLGLVLALLAFSRVCLGWHHISDTLFAVALGGWAGAVIYVYGVAALRPEPGPAVATSEHYAGSGEQ